MKTKTTTSYICDICGASFSSKKDALEHEQCCAMQDEAMKNHLPKFSCMDIVRHGDSIYFVQRVIPKSAYVIYDVCRMDWHNFDNGDLESFFYKEDDLTLVATAEEAAEFSKSLGKQCQERFGISLHDFVNSLTETNWFNAQ